MTRASSVPRSDCGFGRGLRRRPGCGPGGKGTVRSRGRHKLMWVAMENELRMPTAARVVQERKMLWADGN